MKRPVVACLAVALLSLSWGPARAGDALGQAILDLQHRWAVANYQTPEGAKEDAFAALAERAHAVTAAFSGRAEPLVWEGIILSTYAGVKGGLGALGLAGDAKDRFEAAAAIDPNALNGSIYTSLGILYHEVPGWPLSFGDDDKARAYLKRSLSINPTGIDPNYFYGKFLLDQDEYAAAVKALDKAAKAPDRPGRPLADRGRRAEVQAKLEEARKHLQ